MASFSDLVGSFLQSAMTSSGGSRIGSAIESLQQSGASIPGAGGASANNLLGGVFDALQGGLSSAAQHPVQAGGLGALVGSVLGGGKGAVGGAVGGGLLAMLGGVAVQALQSAASGTQHSSGDWGSEPSSDAPIGLRPPHDQAEADALESKAQLILKGMINAAKADGQISPTEMQRIVGKMQEAGTDAVMQQWVMNEMQQPLDVASFAAEIPNPEVAAEVYAASLLAVEVDTDAERQYLDQLASASGLHPLVVGQIRRTLGVQG